MADYLLTPEKGEQPSGLQLLEELHRRGFPVEIKVKGDSTQWESIRFSQEGPPLVECSLSFDEGQGRYTVAIPHDSPLAAGELQMFLVDVLLKALGGQVDNLQTRERLTRAQFAAKLRHLHSRSGKAKDMIWLFFAWGVAILSLVIFFLITPGVRYLVLGVFLLSLASASVQTILHFKNP